MRFPLLAFVPLLIAGLAGCSRDGRSSPGGSGNSLVASPPTGQSGAEAKASPPANSGSKAESADSPPAPHDGLYRCARVIDANTLELENVGAVALVGIRAPTANEPGGSFVISQLRQAVERGNVSAEFCPTNSKNDAGQFRAIIAYRDRSGRLRNLNQLMIMQGLARLIPDEKCHIKFSDWKQYQEFAQENQKGLWKSVWANQLDGGRSTGASQTQPNPPATGQMDNSAARDQQLAGNRDHPFRAETHTAINN